MISTHHINPSSYQLSIFWPQTLQLMEMPVNLLGDALNWFTGTATTKDVNSMKQRVNQLIETQSMQQETMVHILSILNVT